MKSFRLLGRLLVVPSAVALTAFACSPDPLTGDTTYLGGGGPGGESDDPATTPDDYEAPPPADCDGPLGPGQDPSELTECCPEFGHAHCLPEVNDKLSKFFGGCDGGGYCVADEFIETGGVFEPKACTSLSGAEGVCLSKCAPGVAEKAGLLPQDVCKSHEACVPCISPLDGSDTKACTLGYTCDGGYNENPTPPEGTTTEPECPHVGPPLLDPATLASCDGCGLGHCLGNDLIPKDKQGMFASCNSTSMCVPDQMIETGGNFIPDTCESLAGVEGRCLSTCLPDIAAKSDSLPQSSCADEHLCVPCFDPISGDDTGACKLSCDPGPGPKQVLPNCCGGNGTCFPKSAIPQDKHDSLPTESVCPDELGGDELVCVPTMFLEDTAPKACVPLAITLLYGNEYAAGACLPDCLPSVDNPLVMQDGCDAGFKCAPCTLPPFGDPTGACATP